MRSRSSSVRGSSPPSDLIETSPFSEWRGTDVGEVEATCELRAAVLAAEAELAALYREQAIARARAAERDATLLLQ